MTTTTFELTTPGGTPITLVLGHGNDYRATVLSLAARGATAPTYALTGSQIHTTRGRVELGAANLEVLQAALTELDKIYAVEFADKRAAVDAAAARARARVQARVEAERRAVAADCEREARERQMMAGGWR